MATMFPNDIQLIDCTESEKSFFNALKEQLPDRIYVFHSVKWYTQRNGKRENSESDFLIFDPDFGYITVEVKGGKGIEINGNQWILILDEQEERKLKRSPFDQAEESMHFFKKYYFEQYSQFFDGVFGFSCAFPYYDVPSDLGPQAPNELIIDYSDMNNLNQKINKIFHYWSDVRKGKSFLVKDTIKKFLNMINKKVNLGIISGAYIEQQERRLFVLNQIQNNHLDFIENYNQAFIVGGAGTGKTFMAIKKAIRIAGREKKVLVLCFNSELSEYISDKLNGFDNIEISTYWQFCSKILPHNLFAELCLHKDLPGVFDQLMKLSQLPKYDAIIIDEAQDFTEEWAMSTRLFLKDEIQSHLYVFFDSDQNIFRREFKNGFLIDTPPFLLRENLRNTSAIFKWIKTNTPYGQNTRPNYILGVEPERYTFKKNKDAFQRLESLLKTLVHKEKVPFSSITILSNRKFSNSLLSDRAEIGPFSIKHKKDEGTENSILFKTIQSFKGLESDVVIYLNHTDGNEFDDRNLPLEYVAYTRAKFLLYVFDFIN